MGKHRENKRKPKRQGKVITVGKAESVPPGRGATVKLKDGTEVALYNVKGQFYAIENSSRTKVIRWPIRGFMEI